MENDVVTWGETYRIEVEAQDADGATVALDETYSAAMRVARTIGGAAVAEPVATITGGKVVAELDTGAPAFRPGAYFFDVRITDPDGNDVWTEPVRLYLEERVTPQST